MKLVRVVSKSGSSSGTITNVFSSDLTIKPNSTIGLASASINLSDTNIDVNNDNNAFSYKLGGTSVSRNVLLTNGVYNQATMIDELNLKMNSALDIDGVYDAGFQWKTTANGGNINIGFNRSSGSFPSYDLKTSNITIDSLNSSIIRNSVTTGLYDQYAGSSKLFINSCGAYKGTIVDNGVSNVDIKLCMGLTSSKIDTTQSELLPTDYKYAISLDNGYYNVINDGVSSNSGAKFEIGDTIDMNISLAKLNFCTIRAGGLDENLDTIEWDFEPTHLAVSVGSNNTGFADVSAHLDPYQTHTSLGITYHPTPLLEYNLDDFLLGATNSKVSLLFSNYAKLLLGFINNTYSINLKSSSFNAEKKMYEATTAPSILVELASVNTLQSFDGKSGDRRSILSVIPSLNMVNNNIVFQPSQILPIELNNAFEYKINQLVVRLLNHDDDQEISLGDKGACLSLVVA